MIEERNFNPSQKKEFTQAEIDAINAELEKAGPSELPPDEAAEKFRAEHGSGEDTEQYEKKRHAIQEFLLSRGEDAAQFSHLQSYELADSLDVNPGEIDEDLYREVKDEMVKIELKYRRQASNLKNSNLGRVRGDQFVRNALFANAEEEYPDISKKALNSLIDYILKTTH